MPSVRVRENEYFDAALRRFKRACEKAGVLTEPGILREAHAGAETQEGRRGQAAPEAQHPGLDGGSPRAHLLSRGS